MLYSLNFSLYLFKKSYKKNLQSKETSNLSMFLPNHFDFSTLNNQYINIYNQYVKLTIFINVCLLLYYFFY